MRQVWEGTNLKENLLELSADGMLHLEFKSVNLDTFWLTRKSKYPELTTEALKDLIPFATSYLCATFEKLVRPRVPAQLRGNFASEPHNSKDVYT